MGEKNERGVCSWGKIIFWPFLKLLYVFGSKCNFDVCAFNITHIKLCVDCFRNDSQRKLASVADAYNTANEVRDQANKEMTEIKARLYRGNTSITVSGSSGLKKYSPGNNFQYISQPSDSGVNLSNNNLANSMNEPTSSKNDFEFLVPQAPVKRQEKFVQKDTHGLSKYKTESQVNMIGSTIYDVPKLQSHYSNDLPEKLSSTESEPRLANGQRSYYDEDRYSVSSSTSSLGILTPEELNCELCYIIDSFIFMRILYWVNSFW